MATPTILFAVLLALVMVGVGCIALIWWYWKKAGNVVGDLWPKVISIGIQLLAGVVTMLAAYSVGADKDEWFPAAVCGVLCVALWGVVKELVDNRVKAADQITRAELEEAERQGELRTDLLTVFREAVKDKIRRLVREVRNPPERQSVAIVRKALTPATHLEELLQSLAVSFSAMSDGEMPNQNFRVGLYAVRGDVVEPIQAVDLKNPTIDVFSSHRKHADQFSLANTENVIGHTPASSRGAGRRAK